MVTIIIPHIGYLSYGITLKMQYEIIVEVIIHIMLGQRSFSYFKYELQILGLLHIKD